ncbi:PAS domain-containing hybrid sensor histidine kinase/response regulator [Desulfobacula phenolica]|uniref:histidine kinase n=1 Tax=Desulfobacula phenolica TaxID=90732 RepID=A0A1H2DQ73_9BACT|nr:ATP-binding protein [Desulfobacula phenolica]SDT85005.1 Signal transduction histidine kinase [Desulfobacula phenolica]
MEYTQNSILEIRLKTTEKQKIWLVSVFTIALFVITYYLHTFYNTHIVFTHLYYIPIIIASLWWQKKGFYLACFLSLFLMLHSHFVVNRGIFEFNVDDILRAMMFLIIGAVTAILSDNLIKKEKEKKNSEIKYKKLVDHMDSGVLVCCCVNNNNDFVITDVNHAVELIGNIKKQEIQGKRILEVFPYAKSSGLFDVLQNVLASGKPEHHDIKIYMDKKIVGWRKNYVYRLNSKEVVVVYRDVTRRKIAEKKLKENEKKFRAIMESMKEPMYICGQDFIVEYMNPVMFKRIGHDATGEICFKSFHGFDQQCPWCDYESVIKGNPREFDFVSPKDGCFFQVSSTPIENGDGSVSMLSVLRDTTEIEQIQARLQQSQKMEAIGTLAGGIAHDFNNILFPIMGLAEMLIEDTKEEDQGREFLDEILKGCFRAKELIKQILTFSRQHGHQIIPLQIQPIVKEIIKLSRSSLPSTIEINQIMPAGCGAIMGDPIKIHQILMNLVTNSFHSMENTGGVLTIEVNEVEITSENSPDPKFKQGVYISLTISDTGMGMDALTMEKIFEPYFTTKDKNKGTGLGLAVVHGIVKSHKGEILVKSEPGKGTEVTIYFPRIISEINSGPKIKPEPDQVGNERILLIDDEQAITSLLRLILERLGYSVASRNSSTDALEAFRAAPENYDIVITDLTMPNITGDRLAIELKKIRPDIPIILCTGFSEKISTRSVSSMGIDKILVKPVGKKEFAMSVREVLDGNVKNSLN